eukprot:6190826-Pleurochrysis_carterae.AAC.1
MTTSRMDASSRRARGGTRAHLVDVHLGGALALVGDLLGSERDDGARPQEEGPLPELLHRVD